MKKKQHATVPATLPVVPRIDSPAADVVILESLYRRIGLPPYPAIAAAWNDYNMFRPPTGRRRLIT
ncbi:MAG: hypothetical protein ACPGVU_20380 [Limisphaerales bacterium]